MTARNISALLGLPLFLACGGGVSSASNLVTRASETWSGPASAMAENKNADGDEDADEADDPGTINATDRGLTLDSTPHAKAIPLPSAPHAKAIPLPSAPHAKAIPIGSGWVVPKPEQPRWEGLIAAQGEGVYFCAWERSSLFCWGDGALFARRDHRRAIVDVAANDEAVAVVLDSGEVVYHGKQQGLGQALVEVEANAELFCGLDRSGRASCSDGRKLVDTGPLQQLVMGTNFVAALARDSGQLVRLDGELKLPSQPLAWTKLVGTADGVCGYRAGSEGAYRCTEGVAYALRQDNDKGAELWASGSGALCKWDGDERIVCGSTRTGVEQVMDWPAKPRLVAPVDGGGCGVHKPQAAASALFCWGDQADLKLPTP